MLRNQGRSRCWIARHWFIQVDATPWGSPMCAADLPRVFLKPNEHLQRHEGQARGWSNQPLFHSLYSDSYKRWSKSTSPPWLFFFLNQQDVCVSAGPTQNIQALKVIAAKSQSAMSTPEIPENKVNLMPHFNQPLGKRQLIHGNPKAKTRPTINLRCLPQVSYRLIS